MGEWAQRKVRDVVSHIASGPSPTCEERNASGAEWGLLKTTAATWGGWNEKAHKVPPPEYWGQERLEVHKDDVVITKAGPRNRVGVVVHVPATRPRLMVSGKMVLLRPDQSQIAPRLLADVLASRPSQKFLDDRTTGMAEAQTNFANSALLNTSLLLPPLEEQLRIAEVLDTIDETIQATEYVIAKLRSLSAGLLRERLDFSAECQPLGEVCELLQDGTHLPPARVKDGPLLLSVQNLRGGELRQSDRDTSVPEDFWRSTLRTLPIRPGDVCLAVVGATVGKLGVVPEGLPPFTVQRSLTVLRGKPSVIADGYLYSAMSHPEFQRRLWSRANQTAQPGVYLGELRQIEIPVPAVTEQEETCRALESVADRVQAEQEQLRALDQVRAGLTSDLLSGRVRTVAA